MNKVAIISAAGWKSAGQNDGLAECPECFLPLGDGTTTLSRAATVLTENEFDVYIAIGTRGYPFDKYVRLFAIPHPPVPDNSFRWDDSPWTQERYDYAETLGIVIEVPDPGGWSTSWDTFCIAMDIIGEENWEHLFLARGDMLIPRNCLETIINSAYPYVFLFTAFHSYFQLDAKSAKFLRAYVEPFRRFRNEKSWKHDKNLSPDHWGTAELKKAGFSILTKDSLPAHRWTDIDVVGTYHNACNLVANEKYDSRAIHDSRG